MAELYKRLRLLLDKIRSSGGDKVAHKHVMLLEFSDDGDSRFYCSDCPAIVEVLPIESDQGLKLGLVVTNPGLAEFDVDDMPQLARRWHAEFHSLDDDRRSRVTTYSGADDSQLDAYLSEL